MEEGRFAMSLGGLETTQFEIDQAWNKYDLKVLIPESKQNARLGPRLELISRGMAWFDLLELVQDIQILSDPRGDGGILVKLTTPHKGGVIRYSTDGSDPDLNATVYTEPFTLDDPGVLRAKVWVNGIQAGSGSENFDIHMGTGKSVKYLSTYSKGYTGGGEKALVDGKTGSTGFKDGRWQGFLKKDCEVIIDLGSTLTINQVSASFLQDYNAWIFLPEQVEYAFSINGKDFTDSVSIDYQLPAKDGKLQRKSFTAKARNQDCRYIKVKAKNIGLCPEWHQGKGNAAWLFVDEIIIK